MDYEAIMDDEVFVMVKRIKSALDSIFIPDDIANEIVLSDEETGGREFDFTETYGLLSAKIDDIVNTMQKARK